MLEYQKAINKIAIIILIGIMFLVTSCNNRKERIEMQVHNLYSNTINLPYSDMDTLVIDSVNLIKGTKYQLLVYLDSTECTPCYASHHEEWEYILNECRKYEPSIALSIIIDSKNVSDNIKRKFVESTVKKSIYIDANGAFRKINPVFPESNIMHVILLDKDNKVVLVGNPLNNKKIEELLYQKLRES